MKAKLLNTGEGVDIEKLLPLYPYRDEQGNPVLDESLEDYAKRTKQTLNTVRRQADRVSIPVIQNGVGRERRVNLYAMFLKTIRAAEKYVKMTE
ncbi:DNA-binding protein [Salmonella enterica subsp. enterica serovar Anecho]|nr:DNA-binding protein [Salmonella enterica subsp. enterica serovar Anecho]